VLDSLVWVCGSESVLCVGEFGVGLWMCVLCVGQFGMGLWERGCAVCGTVWCGFGGVSVCCVWESFV